VTYENVRFTAPNIAGDRTNSYFYNVSGGILYKKNKVSGSTVSTYPSNFPLSSVSSLQFDGVYYWTLERQTGGFLIRKWEIVNGILTQRSIFSFVSDAMIQYDAYSFVVDSINTVLTTDALIGSNSIEVSDTSEFNVGDTVVLGPSTYSGYTDKVYSAVVVGKDSNHLYFSSAIGASFSTGNGVYCSRYFYVFNKYSPFDTSRGSLLRYEFDTGTLSSFFSGSIFSDVKASCFYGGKILFVKGNEVVFVNSGSMVLYKHMAVDNLDADRATTIVIYGLVAYSDVLYRLQNKYVFYSTIDGWDYEDWDTQYNYTTSSLLSQVYFIELTANPDMIHSVAPPYIASSTSNITVLVLDQYRTPMVGKTVNLTTSIGSITPTTGTTDTNGELTAVYSGTSSEAVAEIKATVV
jgi:hypothetical protein